MYKLKEYETGPSGTLFDSGPIYVPQRLWIINKEKTFALKWRWRGRMYGIWWYKRGRNG